MAFACAFYGAIEVAQVGAVGSSKAFSVKKSQGVSETKKGSAIK